MKKIFVVILMSVICKLGYGQNHYGQLDLDTVPMKIVGIIESKTMCLVTNIQKRFRLGDIHIRKHERRVMLPQEQLFGYNLSDKSMVRCLYEKKGYVYIEDCFLLIEDVFNNLNDSLIKSCLYSSYSFRHVRYEPSMTYLGNESFAIDSKYSYQSFLTDRFLIVETSYENCFNKQPNISYADSNYHDFWLKPTDKNYIQIAIPIICL